MLTENFEVRDSKLAIDVDEKRIDAIFADMNQCHLPGAAVGIAINGRPVYRKGFGLATMELPLTLTPSTRLRIYSTTKHFTCLSFMLLCEDGKADIDDPLGKYFPEFHAVTKKATMRQLMGNTSGLRDAHCLNFQFCGTQWIAPSTETMEVYRTIDDVDEDPGTHWIYNNAGFVLLSNIIERVSGQALGDFMRERIFERVGMHDTLLRRRDTDFVPGSATMHMTAAEGGFIKSYVGGDRSGTGGIVTTVNDMLRWLAHMDAPTVGSAKTWALMKTPQVLENGTSTGYGLGLFLDSYRGVETIHHPGSGLGSNAHILKVPACGLDIIIMVNREDVSSWGRTYDILDACIPGLEPKKKPFNGPFVTGVYRSERTGRVIRLFARNGQQLGSVGDYSDLSFVPDELGVLRPTKAALHPNKYTIGLVGNRESPEALRYGDYGNVDELTVVPPAENGDLASIEGHYHSDSTGIDVTISERGMRTVGRFGELHYGLECLAKDIWRAKVANTLAPFLSGTLSFDAEGFRFWSFGSRGLPFRRIA